MLKRDARLTGRASLLMCCTLASLLLGAETASTATVSYVFDQSNVLPDGANYGTVEITEIPNGIEFLVTANSSAYINGVGKNFGIDKFGFGTLLDLKKNQVKTYKLNGSDWVSAGWDTKLNQNVSGFGEFGVQVAGKPAEAIKVVVSGLSSTQAVLSNFLVDSKKKNGQAPDQGSVFFVAHIKGFNKIKVGENKKGEESHFAGAVSPVVPVPEPSTIAFVVSGLGAAGLMGLRHRRRS